MKDPEDRAALYQERIREFTSIHRSNFDSNIVYLGSALFSRLAFAITELNDGAIWRYRGGGKRSYRVYGREWALDESSAPEDVTFVMWEKGR